MADMANLFLVAAGVFACVSACGFWVWMRERRGARPGAVRAGRALQRPAQLPQVAQGELLADEPATELLDPSMFSLPALDEATEFFPISRQGLPQAPRSR